MLLDPDPDSSTFPIQIQIRIQDRQMNADPGGEDPKHWFFFSFSFQEGTAEDKGVDLYVLERAFLR
jgi:hypothetical protein